MKTIKQSIIELTQRGYNIEYILRANGSPLIKKINGKEYKDFKGNERARLLTKSKLSQKQLEQRLYASRSRESYKAHQKELIKKARIQKAKRQYLSKTKPSQIQTKLINKIRRVIKKENKKSKIKMKNVRFNNKTIGRVETTKKLKGLLRYIQGYAYKDNVMALEERLRKLDPNIFKPLIRYLNKNIDEILENDISLAHNLIYDFINANAMGDSYPINALKDELEKLFNIKYTKEEDIPAVIIK